MLGKTENRQVWIDFPYPKEIFLALLYGYILFENLRKIIIPALLHHQANGGRILTAFYFRPGPVLIEQMTDIVIIDPTVYSTSLT